MYITATIIISDQYRTAQAHSRRFVAYSMLAYGTISLQSYLNNKAYKKRNSGACMTTRCFEFAWIRRQQPIEDVLYTAPLLVNPPLLYI